MADAAHGVDEQIQSNSLTALAFGSDRIHRGNRSPIDLSGS